MEVTGRDYRLICGDCLQIMPTLAPGSVDAIITDIPYGTTACSWDTVLPFAPMWAAIKHVLKPRGVFVTTASQPFTSLLVCSNLEWFRYEVIWKKTRPNGFLDANNKPMKSHENILVFGDGAGTYNPQDLKRKHSKNKNSGKENVYGKVKLSWEQAETFTNYPDTILEFASLSYQDHPTQKPEALYRYLILTYTNPGETVLDMTAGSFTTGAACLQTGRKFVGIEKERQYFDIGVRRMHDAAQHVLLPGM